MNQAGYKAPGRTGAATRGGRRNRDGNGKGGRGSWHQQSRTEDPPETARKAASPDDRGAAGESRPRRGSSDSGANSANGVVGTIESAWKSVAVAHLRDGEKVRGVLVPTKMFPMDFALEQAVWLEPPSKPGVDRLVLKTSNVQHVRVLSCWKSPVRGTSKRDKPRAKGDADASSRPSSPASVLSSVGSSASLKQAVSPGKLATSPGKQAASPGKPPTRSPKLRTHTPLGGETLRKHSKSPSTAQTAAVEARPRSAKPFKTDTDISRATATKQKELQPWVDPDAVDDVGTLADVAGGEWDQFAANKEKFGVVSTYDERYYTTSIDKSHPEYAKREKRAAEIAREIEKAGHGGNVHIAEERGLAIDDSGYDEEDLYSGVARKPVVRNGHPEHKTSDDPAIIYARASSNQANHKKPPFDQFVRQEARAASATPTHYQEREKYDRLHDFREFSAKYKISSPVPPDLLPLLGAGRESAAGTPDFHSAGSSLSPSGKSTSSVPGPAAAAPAKPKKKFNFTASAGKVASFRPSTSTAPQLRSADGLFDYFAHLKKTDTAAPRAFTTPPTWASGSDGSYRDQFPIPLPMVMPMPYGFVYPPQVVPTYSPSS